MVTKALLSKGNVSTMSYQVLSAAHISAQQHKGAEPQHKLQSWTIYKRQSRGNLIPGFVLFYTIVLFYTFKPDPWKELDQISTLETYLGKRSRIKMGTELPTAPLPPFCV
ncbi:hypothetical protein DUI87_22909 [Hirundo rustica rustica]|uniref:Uncharacterized protein n=1 Tax=Hirundo rustica rustica TaxID=333673 RepID=A0A3M0JGV6_HIRRU|nr:hypothetical protein DUI87_22909 [Hirundo rustica rustica]